MKIEPCPVCGVQIHDDAKVVFYAGPPGTRSRLHARVCQFLPAEKAEHCINQGDHECKRSDYYD